MRSLHGLDEIIDFVSSSKESERTSPHNLLNLFKQKSEAEPCLSQFGFFLQKVFEGQAKFLKSIKWVSFFLIIRIC